MSDPSGPARSIGQRIRSYFVTGAVFVVPAVLTVGILAFVLQFFFGYLSPVVSMMEESFGATPAAADLLTLVLALAVVVLIGAVLETVPYGSTAAELFHRAAEAIPGIGNVYGGFREMSETVADGEESFRDVKLVEYLSEGSYTMAFVTADPGVPRGERRPRRHGYDEPLSANGAEPRDGRVRRLRGPRPGPRHRHRR